LNNGIDTRKCVGAGLVKLTFGTVIDAYLGNAASRGKNTALTQTSDGTKEKGLGGRIGGLESTG
jgi:hypothetical protein